MSSKSINVAQLQLVKNILLFKKVQKYIISQKQIGIDNLT